MNWKAWAPLAVAIVLGMVAAITARNLVTRRPAASTAGAGPQIVVVKQPILPGQEIRPDDVTTAALAWKESPEGTFKTVNDVVGRVATFSLVRGQPVLESLLAAQGAAPGLQALVPEGMRAISIEVNEFGAVAGLIGPGCSVDVVATVEDIKNKDRVARTIVQDVKVLAVGQRVSAAKDAPKDPKDPAAVAAAAAAAATPDQLFKSVTLLTTPAEAEALELASMTGRPRLVLRGQRDSASVKSNGISVAQLAGASDEPSSQLLAPAPFAEVKTAAVAATVATTRPSFEQQVVRVYKGGVESTVTFNVPRPAEPQQPRPASQDNVLTGADTGPAIAR